MTHLAKRDLMGIAKSIDPGQPVQSDHGQSFLLLADFLCINSLSNDKILDCSKLKAFAEDKINVTKELKFVVGWEGNIVGKGEDAGCQHSLLFPQCFQKAYFTEVLKVRIVW